MVDSGGVGAARTLTSDEFRNVIGHFATGVTVITAAHGDQRFGTTASAVSSLSLEPPMVLICINKDSSTGQAIAAAGAFAINVLTEDQGALAEHFARKGGDKWSAVEAIDGSGGQPLLADALAHLECRVVEEVTGGTHTVFLSAVTSATAREGAPLAYFRGKFGRLEMAHDHQVYQGIRERVLTGDIGPHQALTPSALAEQYQVPAGALYHALGKLVSDGLLERRPSGEFAAKPLAVRTIEDALDARAMIELAVVERVIERLSATELAQLRRAAEDSLAVAPDGDVRDLEECVRAGNAFHETLVGLAGSEALLSAYRRLALPGMMVRALQGYTMTHADASWGRDHLELAEALETKDLRRSKAIVASHLQRIGEQQAATVRAAGARP
jgi:flavin reductase (DIM6/NTAB) family NADH-FMN oxidoreductase RutF/DNA-binding FadR family transcriptional regulator